MQDFLNDIDGELTMMTHLIHKEWGHLGKKEQYYPNIKWAVNYIKALILKEYIKKTKLNKL